MFGTKKPETPAKAPKPKAAPKPLNEKPAPPVAKAEPVNPTKAVGAPTGNAAKLADDFPVEFAQGVKAREASIAKEDAPYGESKELDAWLAGFNHREPRIV